MADNEKNLTTEYKQDTVRETKPDKTDKPDIKQDTPVESRQEAKPDAGQSSKQELAEELASDGSSVNEAAADALFELKKEHKNPKALKKKSFSLPAMTGLLATALIFCAMMFVLYMVERNVIYEIRPESISLIAEIPENAHEKLGKEADTRVDSSVKLAADFSDISVGDGTLIIYEQGDDNGETGLTFMSEILEQMKEGYETMEIRDFEPQHIARYDKVILCVSHYQHFENDIGAIKQWVRNGGNLMLAFPPDYNGSFAGMFDVLGIRDCGGTFATVKKFRFAKDFMIGSEGHEFLVTDAYDSGLSLSLADGCEVYLETDEQYPIPLIWRKNTGSGCAVVMNLGFLEKAQEAFTLQASVLWMITAFIL